MDENKENEKEKEINNDNYNINNIFDLKRNSVKIKKKNTIYILNDRNEGHANKNDIFNWEKFFCLWHPKVWREKRKN